MPVLVTVITVTSVSHTPGQTKFKEFLEKYGISLSEAGRVFGVNHVTVRNWVLGLASPSREMRKAIEVWTSGFVAESDWLTDKEHAIAEKVADVQPFVPPTAEAS